ncbi:hypothetical protein DITRI_Ditri13aG0014000 [Diplodiscus trichospermus]
MARVSCFRSFQASLYIPHIGACHLSSPQTDQKKKKGKKKAQGSKARMKGAIISVLVALAMVQFMAKPGEAAVTCQDVDSSLAPCVPYLSTGAGNPSGPCCDGVRRIKDIAQTTPDKQAACNCAKDAAARMPSLKEDAAASLPAKCNVQVSFPISKSIDCSR